ncbi:hypothetical protein BpHYR1_043571 [Brachionus plicatilis]|uniref:Uncharacterized protein n=1 Tax=Brachionus plicatilis TaxID=10195 RepID=A0A3M7SNA4_BRAPC|nr:hypothetical protein BpHYR1_043571 [Brachionus plicatilis]
MLDVIYIAKILGFLVIYRENILKCFPVTQMIREKRNIKNTISSKSIKNGISLAFLFFRKIMFRKMTEIFIICHFELIFLSSYC